MEHLTRRRVLLGLATTVASLWSRPADLGTGSARHRRDPPPPACIEDLVAANRILVDQGVLDGYGHVSVRHDRAADRYLMARSLAPELVTAADIMEYDLDSVPVDARGRADLSRALHPRRDLSRRVPTSRAVVHNHSPSVIPFGVTGAALRPLYHMSAFLGGGVPVFDIRAGQRSA